jgi:glycolate oxidase
VALAAFAKLSAACETVGKILASGITPLVTEIMDADVIRAIDDLQQSRKQARTLPLDADALLLVGVDGDPDEVERDMAVIVDVLRKSGATSVQQARTPEESEALWEARRSVSPAIIRLGNSRFGEDIVVPRSQIPRMVEITKQIGKQYDLTIAVFGHIGDGNLHPNIVCDRRDAEMMKRVEAASHAIFDAAIELGGAISGEHGIGLLKTAYMPKSVDPVALAMMQSIKKLIDPNNIMNPGKKLGAVETW